MANALFESGRQAMAAGTANFATGRAGTGATQAVLITATSCTGIKAITGATTGAAAAAVACVNTFAVGDMVCITQVGGTVNANNMWVLGPSTSGTSLQLMDPITGAQGTLITTYTSGGFAINLGGVTAQTFTNFSAAVPTGTPTYAMNTVLLPGTSEVQGIVDATATTFTAVTAGPAVIGIMLVACASSAASIPVAADIPLAWIDGTFVITTAAAIAAATSLPVERIPAAFPTGTYIFTDTAATYSVVVSGGNTQFSRVLTVTSVTVPAAARCMVPATGSGLPVTPNGGNISVTWDTVASPPLSGQHVGIFKL